MSAIPVGKFELLVFYDTFGTLFTAQGAMLPTGTQHFQFQVAEADFHGAAGVDL